jgi:peptidoglycan hydrolase-like protein with peptidoglycan-binding domain
MRIGDSGNDVSAIQQKLIDLKILKIPTPTGYFGEQTEKAVRIFQSKNGLDADGIVGKLTGPKLMGGAIIPIKPPIIKEPKNIIISDSLKTRNIVFNPFKETTPFTVREEGCAKFVSDSLQGLGIPRQGHAWFARSMNEGNLEFNAFKNINPSALQEMSKIFSLINKNPEEGSAEGQVKSLIQRLIPNQGMLKSKLGVNDIVGLYYDGSHNFTKAFFESATGFTDMGTGTKVTGTYFRRADNNSQWTPGDLTKNLSFVPGNTLKSGGGFTFNTHLGYVGAIVDGEPIIFHSIDKSVKSTPFSKMKSIKILWIKSGTEDNTGKKIAYSTTTWDKMKKGFS